MTRKNRRRRKRKKKQEKPQHILHYCWRHQNHIFPQFWKKLQMEFPEDEWQNIKYILEQKSGLMPKEPFDETFNYDRYKIVAIRYKPQKNYTEWYSQGELLPTTKLKSGDKIIIRRQKFKTNREKPFVPRRYRKTIEQRLDETQMTEEERIKAFINEVERNDRIDKKYKKSLCATPPLGYICHKCGQSDHFIDDCTYDPTIDNPIQRIYPRLPMGLPKSMLEEITNPENYDEVFMDHNTGKYFIKKVQTFKFR